MQPIVVSVFCAVSIRSLKLTRRNRQAPYPAFLQLEQPRPPPSSPLHLIFRFRHRSHLSSMSAGCDFSVKLLNLLQQEHACEPQHLFSLLLPTLEMYDDYASCLYHIGQNVKNFVPQIANILFPSVCKILGRCCTWIVWTTKERSAYKLQGF